MGRTKILGKWGQAKKEKPLGNFWGIFKFFGGLLPLPTFVIVPPLVVGARDWRKHIWTYIFQFKYTMYLHFVLPSP
jgi:hypothetical protein